MEFTPEQNEKLKTPCPDGTPTNLKDYVGMRLTSIFGIKGWRLDIKTLMGTPLNGYVCVSRLTLDGEDALAAWMHDGSGYGTSPAQAEANALAACARTLGPAFHLEIAEVAPAVQAAPAAAQGGQKAQYRTPAGNSGSSGGTFVFNMPKSGIAKGDPLANGDEKTLTWYLDKMEERLPQAEPKWRASNEQHIDEIKAALNALQGGGQAADPGGYGGAPADDDIPFMREDERLR